MRLLPFVRRVISGLVLLVSVHFTAKLLVLASDEPVFQDSPFFLVGLTTSLIIGIAGGVHFLQIDTVVERLAAFVTKLLTALLKPRLELDIVRRHTAGVESRSGLVTSGEGARGTETQPHRRVQQRLAVDVMTREFDKSLTTSSVALFAALILLSVYAILTGDRDMIVMASVIGAFFLIAMFRQALLRWRTQNGYFGSSEHEVRELLAFAVRHPAPDDFYDDDGHLLPAFDLRPEQAPTTAVVGQPIAGTL